MSKKNKDVTDDIKPKISREDLEAQFSAVKGEIEDRTSIVKDKVVPLAVVGGAVVLIALVYVIGKRVGTKKSAIVEIRRI